MMGVGKMREKMMLSGKTGSGKTRAAFSIAKAVLERTSKNVYYLCMDDKAGKFLKYVRQYVDNRFFLKNCADLITARNDYRFFRALWQQGDWLIIDRSDLVWQMGQAYVRARYTDLSEEDLDELFLEMRASARRGAKTKEEKDKVMRTSAINDFNNLDWQIARGEHNGIIEDALKGPIAVAKELNVVLLARSDTPGFMDKPDDPRMLISLGERVEGEKNVLSLVETHVAFFENKDGYTMTSVKDCERPRFFGEQVVDFLPQYEELVGETVV